MIASIKWRTERILHRLLPRRIFLLLYGIRLPWHEGVAVAVTCLIGDHLHITQNIRLGNATAAVMLVALWLENGIILDHVGQHQYFPPDKIVSLSWFDPVLNEHITLPGRR